MKVRVVNTGSDGSTKCFKVVSINTGDEYILGNCHRSDHPMWRVRNIQCFVGNIEYEDGLLRRASLLLNRNGDNILLLK